MIKRFVVVLVLVLSIVSPVLADDYAANYENRYTIATDFTLPYTSLASFGLASGGTGAISNRIYQNDNSGIDLHTTANSGRYQTLYFQKNDTAVRTKALSATVMKLKWRSAPINSDLLHRVEVIGFGSSIITGLGYGTAGSFSCVCFRMDVTTTNVALSAVTKRGTGAGNETVTTTSFTETLDQDNTFEIIATASSIEFYINGSLEATHTTTIPTAALVPIWGTYNKEAKAKGVSVDWVKFEGPR